MMHDVTESVVDDYLLGILNDSWKRYVENSFDNDIYVQQWFIDRRAFPDHILNSDDGDFARKWLEKLTAADRFKRRLRELLAPSLELTFSLAADAGRDLFVGRKYEWTNSEFGSLQIMLDIQEPESIRHHEDKRFLRIYEIGWRTENWPVEFVCQDSPGLRVISTEIDFGSGARYWVEAETFGRMIESNLPIDVVIGNRHVIPGYGQNIERDN